MADTCGTLCMAVEKLYEAGAKEVYAAITHAILSGPAIKRINDSKLVHLIVTNSCPHEEKKKVCDKLHTDANSNDPPSPILIDTYPVLGLELVRAIVRLVQTRAPLGALELRFSVDGIVLGQPGH